MTQVLRAAGAPGAGLNGIAAPLQMNDRPPQRHGWARFAHGQRCRPPPHCGCSINPPH
jgi:hypothetical protein